MISAGRSRADVAILWWVAMWLVLSVLMLLWGLNVDVPEEVGGVTASQSWSSVMMQARATLK